MQLVFAEVDAAVGGGIRRENRENDLLVLITGDRAHQQDVGLVVGILGVINAGSFLLQLLAEAVLRGKGEAIGKHHHSAYIQTGAAAIAGHLLNAGVVGNFHHGLEHRVRENGLGHFHPGGLLGQVAVGADDLAGGLPGAGVVLLGPEGIGPAGAGAAKQHYQGKGGADQGAEQQGKGTTHHEIRRQTGRRKAGSG